MYTQQFISFEKVVEDNKKQVDCTSIYIVYKNIVYASHKFSVPVVEELSSLRCNGRHRYFLHEFCSEIMNTKYLI